MRALPRILQYGTLAVIATATLGRMLGWIIANLLA
jgi:hypothetical protein